MASLPRVPLSMKMLDGECGIQSFLIPRSAFRIFALVASLAITIFWATLGSAQQNQSQIDLPHPFPKREKAPSLTGGVAWINTSGPLELQDLRGKFVILDFWTYCCINCMHILPELKKLEKAYPNEVVVIGVHSAKFATERDSQEHHRGRAALRDRTSGDQRLRAPRVGKIRREQLAQPARDRSRGLRGRRATAEKSTSRPWISL